MTRFSLFRQPWLHFVVLGSLLYVAGDVMFAAPAVVDADASDSDLRFEEALARRWHLTDPVVIDRLVRNLRFLDPGMEDLEDHEVLAAALEMNLHRNDLIVQRRLVQRMELQAFAPEVIGEPTEDELRKLYSANPERFRQPNLIRFDHVFFSSDDGDAAERARSVVAMPNAADFEAVSDLGDTYIYGAQIGPLDRDRVARQFGHEFVVQLFAGPSDAAQPIGPLKSSYGMHLVWVREVQVGAVRAFEDVRRQLERDWRSQREEAALLEQAAALRQQYGVSR